MPKVITQQQIIAVVHGLRACAMGASLPRGYTPKRFMATATQFTGRPFKPRDYTSAIYALEQLLQEGQHHG
jgi:hypothetical protein